MEPYVDYIKAILFFGLLGVALIWIAKEKGYFSFPKVKDRPPVSFTNVLIFFAIYLAVTLGVAPILAHLLQLLYDAFSATKFPHIILGWLQIFLLSGIALLFYLYSKAQGPDFWSKIWKNQKGPIYVDFLMGVMTWVISFPLVIAVGQLADLLLYYFFGYENYEQVAVRYLKTTLSSPPLLAIALFTILLAAPIIEEFLFRGCLQNFFRRYLSAKFAILCSALCFALFHYAPSQGLGNLSLFAALFTFALFLGFIYERQSSLFASIGLHMTFNAASTFRILFFPES